VIRAISYTETAALLRCQAAWDFQYGDRLAGSALKPKDTPTLLREGRAWGVGVGAFHETGGAQLGRGEMLASLEADAHQQVEAGTYDADSHKALEERMAELFDHYTATTSRLPITNLEHELLVKLPSRSGTGWSNRYRLHTFFDGLHTDEDGRVWIVEFKLRKKLSSLEQVANSRQIRYYAWSWFVETGQRVAGVIVDERLNEVPKPARILKSGKPSHAKEQLTTPELYEQACLDAGEGPHAEVLEALEARRWQARHRVFLTEAEVDEAGEELVSLAQQVQALDAHRLYPVRDVRAQNCNGCRFKEICNSPGDGDLIDVLFNRVPPKRDLPELKTSDKKEVPA
jgi:hypothetical protein